jgi:hypothetical protein
MVMMKAPSSGSLAGTVPEWQAYRNRDLTLDQVRPKASYSHTITLCVATKLCSNRSTPLVCTARAQACIPSLT